MELANEDIITHKENHDIEEIDKNIVANHKIPFTITDNNPIYSEENIARLKAISKEMKEGKYHELNLDEEV